MEETVPVRKRGRLARGFKRGSAFVSGPVANRKCARCPKYDRSKLWCPLRAETRPPSAPACHYGVDLMEAASQEEYRNGRGEKEA